MSSVERELEDLLIKRPEAMRHLNTGIDPFSLKPGFEPPDRYPSGASVKEIDSFSKSLSMILPSDICSWLRITNGAVGFFGTSQAQAGCTIEEIWKHLPEWKLRQWIPVGSDGFGNYYIKPAGKSDPAPVCFVEALEPETLQYAVASDVLRYAWFALNEETHLSKPGESSGWPFGKDFVLARDPELAAFGSEYVLPWDAK